MRLPAGTLAQPVSEQCPKSAEERFLDFLSRFFLHSGRHVGVRVQGQLDRRVPEPLRGHLWVYAGREQCRRVAVPRIVQANAIGESSPAQSRVEVSIDEVARVEGTASTVAEDQIGHAIIGWAPAPGPELPACFGVAGEPTRATQEEE